MLATDFWQDKNSSKKILKEKKFFEDLINAYKDSNIKLNDLNDLNELAFEENNQNLSDEIYKSLKDLRILVKKTKSDVFYLMRQTLWIVTSKFMLEQVGPKARIGLIC